MEVTEFDATLGGTEHLPLTANSFKFASSRSVEIAALTESILRPNKTKLIFQSLPIHMRRRVMSHNCKRLPRRLREGHLEQLKKSGLPPKQKRPSRKYRRRPVKLLEEYTRRQRRVAWLETHIWHAKRFHMIERWGYRLAYRPCDKAFRACYRATSAHCLIQDISYHLPVQIKGPIESISKIFSCITSKSCGLSVSAKSFISGNRAGSLNVYKPYSYPFGYVGKVEFLWLQVTSTPELLIFVHPSQIKEIELILTELINGEDSQIKDTKRMKLSNDKSNVSFEVLHGQFNRFRLTGPKSHAVLTHSLKPISDVVKVSSNEWICHINKCNTDLFLKEKHEYWSNLANVSSPSQLQSNIIFGLIVKDPRWSRPKKRTKAYITETNIDSESLINIPTYASLSPIWSPEIRNIIKKNLVTNTKFIEHITKTHMVPGEVNEDDPTLQSIPIVLIQRPGSQDSTNKRIGFGSGWDIIIPSGYGLPFWLTFIMFGARAGGLRETEHLTYEMGDCYLAPDSDSGKVEEKRIELHLREAYFKHPPSKRVNFIKLGVASPFICPWMILLKDWSHTDLNDLYVLRDKQIIDEMQNALTKKVTINTSVINKDACLVGVYLHIDGKGVLKDNALICLPNIEDFGTNKVLSEVQHEDINFKIRKQKRKEHKQLLKTLRRKRLKLKKKMVAEREKRPKTNPREPSQYVKSMRELWLPSNVNTIRKFCLRETMGYVTKGAFSYTEAKSCGIGYIAFNALIHLIESRSNKVLVRNTSSNMYRFANIKLINHF